MIIIKKQTDLAMLGLTLILAAIQLQTPAFGFTQGAAKAGAVVPQGHEWITRQAAIELLGGERALKLKPDPADPDPRLKWPKAALAQDLTLDAAAQQFVAQIKRQLIDVRNDLPYAATYTPVLDAILGERWVDIGGFNFIESKFLDYNANCLDAVTQEAPELQYDHFMRQPNDVNAQGGIASAQLSTQRFIEYFVNAAMAAEGTMKVWDGGGLAGEITVNRQFFLFGRALHLFEDSFSPDHTVRIGEDFYHQVRQVKSYLCASGSEQHAHLGPPDSKFYETGDVIWRTMLPKPDINDWSAYQPNNIRPYALAAIEGTKDAWAAFIRSMAKPKAERAAYARAQATQVAKNWLKFNEQEMRAWYSAPGHRGPTYVKASPDASKEDNGNGTSVDGCMKRDWKGVSQATKLTGFEKDRKLCLYNMVPDITLNTDFDLQLHTSYLWRWRNALYLETPPEGWNFRQAPETRTVKISIANRTNLIDLRHEGDYVYNDAPNTEEKRKNTLAFEVELKPGIPLEQNTLSFKVVGMDNRVLGRSNRGLVYLYPPPDNTALFTLKRRDDGSYNIYNTNDEQYVYMDTGRNDSWIWNSHSPESKDAQWIIKGLPEPYLTDGTYKIYQKFNGWSRGLHADWQKPSLGRGSMGNVNDWSASLERQQADGAYKLRRGGKYIGINPDGSLEMGTKGDKFYLEPQRKEGNFVIRTEDGRYWKSILDKDIGRLSVSKSCSQDLDPCNPPIIDALAVGDNNNRPGRGGIAELVPQECLDVEKEPCQEPTELHIIRNWSVDSAK